MRKDCRKKRNPFQTGFTLVEVIVVLVVLAILAAIMIPAMTGWIDEANAKRCLVQMGDVRRDYGALAAYNTYEVDDPEPLLEEAVLEMIGQSASGLTFPDGMDGTCSVQVSSDNNSIVDIYCDRHGSLTGQGTIASRTQNAERGVGLLMGDAAIQTTMSNFFDRPITGATGSLDSTGQVYGQPIQAQLNKLLAQNGIPSNVSWGINYERTNSGYKMNIYWTDRDVSQMDFDAANKPSVPYVKLTYTYNKTTKSFTPSDDGRESGMIELTKKTYNPGTGNTQITVLDAAHALPDSVYGASLED